MMQPQRLPTVGHYLQNAAKAQLVQGLDFGGGRQLAIWQNQQDAVQYNGTSGHAFSIYLRGGANALRTDGEARKGYSGAICVFPEGHHSDWKIDGRLEFLHLYISDQDLRAHYARTHDKDARTLSLNEITLESVVPLTRPLLGLAQAAMRQDKLLADVAFAELIGQFANCNKSVSGGLPPQKLKRFDAYLDAHLHENIRLKELAAETGYSEFHFQRMFSQSRGVSPHKWIENERIERAKPLLDKTPLAQVAAQCGFANQSHFTRVFKKMTGLTPAAYKRQLQN